MAFDYTQPVASSPLTSAPIRQNFQALSTAHRGAAAPTSPQLGYTWLDDSNALNWKLWEYVNHPTLGNTWIILAEHVERFPLTETLSDIEMPFFEGSNPPPMVDIDDYNFEDAAAFSASVDQDIIFRVSTQIKFLAGLSLRLRYCMSVADPGVVKFRLDRRIKKQGDSISGGTSYTSTHIVDPVNTANIIAYTQEITIPAGEITADTEAVHCRLARLGSDVADTHPGLFCLFGLKPRVL